MPRPTGDYFWAAGATSTINWDADSRFEQFTIRNAFSHYEFASDDDLFRKVHNAQFTSATPELTLGTLISEGNTGARFTLKSGGEGVITLDSGGTLKKAANRVLFSDTTLVVTVDPDGTPTTDNSFDETFDLDII